MRRDVTAGKARRQRPMPESSVRGAGGGMASRDGRYTRARMKPQEAM